MSSTLSKDYFRNRQYIFALTRRRQPNSIVFDSCYNIAILHKSIFYQ